MTRRLIVNADDFGLTPGVNRGIIESHVNGILTSASLMANMSSAEDAAEFAAGHPDLGVGVHVNLVRGRPLTSGLVKVGVVNGKGSFGGAARLMIAAWNPAAFEAIRTEVGEQVARALELGVRVTHMDTEKHTHVHPRLLRAIIAVAREHGIRAIRAPLEPKNSHAADPHGRLVAAMFRAAARRCRNVLLREGFAVTDHFAGLSRTGDWDAESMADAIVALQPGVTELMVHPGCVDSELIGIGTRLVESRPSELDALTSGAVREAVCEGRVELAHFGHIVGI